MGSWEGTGVDLIRTCYCILKKNELGLSVLEFELQEEQKEHVTSLKGKAEVWTEGLWCAEVTKALCFPFKSQLNGLTFH